jgi:flavin-dependent dehydrogenase
VSPVYDVIIIGGGPAGSTCATVMSRHGLKVLLLERTPHPRFHIGESFLPRNVTLMRDLGFLPELDSIPHTIKYGAEFGFGHEEKTRLFRFDQGFRRNETRAFNIERAPFDEALLRAAAREGAEVREGVAVRSVRSIADGRVVLGTTDETVESRYLVDASGQSAFIGRRLGLRRVLPGLRKAAYFSHCRGVERNDGEDGGNVIGIMCKEGWFWLIPIDQERTSIGIVMDADAAMKSGVPPKNVLTWALERCPQMARRCQVAEIPPTNHIAAEFSHICKPYAGPGYFLVGDAAAFVDPLFSTGVCLGMMAAKLAGDSIAAVLREGANPRSIRRSYIEYLDRSSSMLFRLVRGFYDHSFRELFLQARDSLGIRRAILTILAGNVFRPDPSFSLLWRLRLFEMLVAVNRYVPLVPRLQSFSLFEQRPIST